MLNATEQGAPYPFSLAATLPPDLLEAPRWIVFALERETDETGEAHLKKMPYNARTGKHARSNDARTWSTFAQACKALASGTYGAPGELATLGYATGDGFACVDLDKCRDADTGALTPEARAIVDELDSYSEVSPSGTGVHVWMRGELPKGGRKRDAGIEMYAGSQFITITGATLEGTPPDVRERTDALTALHARVFAKKTAKTAKPEAKTTPDAQDARDTAGALDDGAVIERAMRAENSAKFARLYFQGDTSGNEGDASRADLALIGLLRFYTRDVAQLDRLFRRSALMRDKWDERHASDGATYGAMTIAKALAESDGSHWTPDYRSAPRRLAVVGKDEREQERQEQGQERDDTGGANGYDADTGRPDDTFLLQYAADDNGNAEAMRALHGHEYLYVQEYGWLKWTGTHWERIPEEIAAKDAIAVLKRRRIAAVLANHEPLVRATKADNQRVNGCLALFRAHMAGPKVDEFDADLDVLNCQNGVFNLKTGVLTPHDSSQRFTYCLPVDYNPNADKTSIEEFVFDCTGRNRNVAEYLQTCAGYSLTGHTREEEFFYIYGPTRSGKGTFCETFRALLGRPLSVEVDFNTFTAKRDADNQNFDLASLKPARMVFASESNKYQSFNPGKMKQITGGNEVRCAFKGKDMFEYRPQFKVWLSSNHPINADVEDDAFWESRAHVIEFPHSRLGAEDKTLKERLRTTASLEGVLRWAVEGARRWYADGTLKAPEEVTRATRAQRAQLDYIGQWISDCCTLAPDAWESSAELMRSYKAWCEDNGHKQQDSKGLSETLVKRFACVAKRQPGTGARGFDGIRLGINPGVTPDDGSSFQVSHPRNAELFSEDDSSTPLSVTPVTPEKVVKPRALGKIEKGGNQVSQVSHQTGDTRNHAASQGVTPESLICPKCGSPDIRDYGGDLRCYVCDEPVTPAQPDAGSRENGGAE